jgi:hypothetical protein
MMVLHVCGSLYHLGASDKHCGQSLENTIPCARGIVGLLNPQWDPFRIHSSGVDLCPAGDTRGAALANGRATLASRNALKLDLFHRPKARILQLASQ